jgi:tRNA A-37 threonylcarbamoyl transferase component Bud32
MVVENASWCGLLLSGRYQVTAKLGAGGMAYVYRAHDKHLDCEVVIKVPRPEMLELVEFAGRFAREVRSLVKLVHPHIVRVTDVGDHDGCPFAVMQYLSGGSLRDRQSAGQQTVAGGTLGSWLMDVAAALDFIHRQGYVHRDVKPDNILFDPHGNVYLSDFGVAKALKDQRPTGPRTAATGTGIVLGTAEYMAPELVMGQHYDGRVDQFALAVVVYELLAGRPPFEGRSPAAVLLKQMSGELPRLHEVATGVSPRVTDAVHRGLAIDPEQRFSDCTSLASALLGAEPAAAYQHRTASVEPMVESPASGLGAAGPGPPCPACGRTSPLFERAVGKRVRCPSCQAVFRVPGTRAQVKDETWPEKARVTTFGEPPAGHPGVRPEVAKSRPPSLWRDLRTWHSGLRAMLALALVIFLSLGLLVFWLLTVMW